MHTFVKWVKTREAVALLTAKLRLFLSQTISCLRSALFWSLEAKQRGSVPGKQVNHVKFLKVQCGGKKETQRALAAFQRTPKIKKDKDSTWEYLVCLGFDWVSFPPFVL